MPIGKRYISKSTIMLTFLIMYLVYNWSSISSSINVIKQYPNIVCQQHPEKTRVLATYNIVKSYTDSMATKTTMTTKSLQTQDDSGSLARNIMTTSNTLVSREKPSNSKSRRPCPDEPCNQSSIPKPASSRTDAVIVLTMMRSGSSIIGSLFNERSDVTYLYEPLYPFGERPCDLLPKGRVQVLRHISRCEFDKLPPLYKKAFLASDRHDKNSRCKIHNICFTSKTVKVSHFLSRDADMCTISMRGLQVCPEPLDLVALNKHCKQSLLVAMKVIHLCKLESLVPLLEDPDYNIKVVHLVRDPRGTLNSRAGPNGKRTVNWARNSTDLICEQLFPNVNFADDVLSKSNVKGKYLRVKYEDFAANPIRIVEKIYNFAGINMNKQIRHWLSVATSKDNNPNLRIHHVQGLRRNPKFSLAAWRKELSLEVVQVVQERCFEALKKTKT